MGTPLRLRRALEWRAIDGEIVALDANTSMYLAANASGAVLWQALAEGATREDLIEALVRESGIAADQAGPDVDRFLAELSTNGLLEE